MDAKIVNLESLFGQPVSYRIPQFQRPYAWNKSGQWEALWDDVRSIAERIAESGMGVGAGNVRPHFMGAIILQGLPNKTAEVDKRLVIDGQQRLTTLQLLVKAAEVIFQRLNDNDLAAKLRTLTRNEESRWGGDSDNETKVRQSNLDDQEAFQKVIRNIEDANWQNQHGINGCFTYFTKVIADWLDSNREMPYGCALHETLTGFLQAAVIDLDQDEKPHVIFETLNARGEPLQQSDLIKNTVMYEANVVDDPVKAGELWGMFSDEWWRKDTKEQRLNRIQVDRFLNQWMTMRARTFVASDRTAAMFRSYVNPKESEPSSSIDEIASDIRNTGMIYRQIQDANYPGIERFLNRIKVLDVGAVMPLLLWLYRLELPVERRDRTIQAIESYLVRRMLCGMGSQGLPLLFIRLIDVLHKGNDDHWADELTVDYLKNQTVDQQIWPNDRIIIEELTTKGMRGNSSRKKMIMEGIESHLRSDFAEELGDTGNLTLEHIMPQKWDEKYWPLPPSADPDNAKDKRDFAVNALGNLTLVTGRLNGNLSNGPWSEKRDTLSRHSGLFLNKELAHKDTWDETQIEQRTCELARKIVKVWPHADDL